MDVVPTDWYKHWFGNEYLTVYAHRNESEAQSLIRLINHNLNLPEEARILDLCCGQGRHVRILADLGYSIVGVDLSQTLLSMAKFRKYKKGKAYFIRADMRFLPAHNAFDLLLNLFTSFGYFEKDEDNQSVFGQFVKALKPDGYFVFDYFNAPHLIQNLVPQQEWKVGNLSIRQERQLNRDRVEKKITIRKNEQSAIFYESVKIYYPGEIFEMMHAAGLKIRSVFGDYHGSKNSPEMPRLIIIGNKMASKCSV